MSELLELLAGLGLAFVLIMIFFTTQWLLNGGLRDAKTKIIQKRKEREDQEDSTVYVGWEGGRYVGYLTRAQVREKQIKDWEEDAYLGPSMEMIIADAEDSAIERWIAEHDHIYTADQMKAIVNYQKDWPNR
jgi:hypothetical protein